MLKLFTISYGFLSVLGWTARKNKNCVSSQRREDPPVGRSLELEDRGEKTFMDLGRLLPRWAVMTASIESLCFYPQVEGKEFPPTGLNGTNSPSHVLPLAVVLGVYFIFMYWPYLSIYLSICVAILSPLWFMTNLWVNTFDWRTGHGHVSSTFSSGKELSGSDSKSFHLISDRDEPAAAVETQAKVVCSSPD